MSFRRMMLATLGSFVQGLIDSFKTRVAATFGIFEAESCLKTQLDSIHNATILQSASLVVTPNAYKEGMLYNFTPSDGKNLLLQSQNFNTSPWLKLGSPNVTVVENTALAPDGTNSASLLTSNFTNGHGLRQYLIIEPSTNYRLSFWAKSDDSTIISADVSDQKGNSFTLTSTWTRYSILGTYRTSYGYLDQFVDIIFGASQLGKTFQLWGAQLELGSVETDYEPTGTTRGGFSVTRATRGTRVNAEGLIETVPYNILNRSEEFDNAAWTKTNCSIIANTQISPVGTLTADTLRIPIDGVAGRHRLAQSSIFASNTTYTTSYYLKKANHRWVQLVYVLGDFGGNAWANFDLEDGVIGNMGPGTIAAIEDTGNGWYRCSVQGTTLVGGSLTGCEILTTNNTNSLRYPSYQSTVAEDVCYIWGAQLVPSSVSKLYIPTSSGFNFPRLDYSNGSCPTILVEPQMTNIFTNNNVTDGYGTNTNSIKGATIPNAFGEGINGFQYTFTNDTGLTFLASTYNIRVVNTTGFPVQRLCLFIKNPSHDFFGIFFSGVSQSLFRFSTLESNSGTGSIVKINPNTYALYIHIDNASTSQFSQVRIAPVTSLLNSAPVNGSAIIGLAFLQGLASGTLPKVYSPIITTAASAARNSDNIARTNVRHLIGQTEGSIFIDFYYKSTDIDFLIFVYESLSNYLFRPRVISNTFSCVYANGPAGMTGAGTFTSSVAIAPNTRNKIVVVYNGATQKTRLFRNGIFIGETTLAFPISTNQNKIDIGNSFAATSKEMNNVSLWKTQLTNAQAIALTTL